MRDLISEENGYYVTDFKEDDLRSFSEFSYVLLGKMTYHKDNMFDSLLRFFLNSDERIESEFTTSAGRFREKAVENLDVKRFHIEEKGSELI